VADDLRWDVVAVQAPVVAGEHPRVLPVGPGNDLQARILSSVDPARRIERRPQQQPEHHRGAERDRDPHPELHDRVHEDQQHESPTETTAAPTAALVAHGCGT
jgi:hypothetical protein